MDTPETQTKIIKPIMSTLNQWKHSCVDIVREASICINIRHITHFKPLEVIHIHPQRSQLHT